MRTLLTALVLSLAFAGSAMADTWISGHYTRSGRWVEGHWRHTTVRPRPLLRSSYAGSRNDGPRSTSYKPPRHPSLPSSYRKR